MKKWGLPLVTGPALVEETVDELDSDKAKGTLPCLGTYSPVIGVNIWPASR